MTVETAISAPAQPSGSMQENIRQLVSRWQEAWNAHDPLALAELVARDVDFITVAGRWLQGVQEFADWHGEIHRQHMRDSRWSNSQYRLRQLGDDLCLVHLEWTTVGDRNIEGTLRSPRHGIFTWLVGRQDGPCWIIAAHNTELRDNSLHRLKG